jgi:hypothetical protein
MSTVDVDFYLVVGQKLTPSGYADGRTSIGTAKNKPSLAAHEVAIAMNLRLPLSLFRKPQLEARIEVPVGQAPFVITPEVQQNIVQAVQDQLGITLRISAPPEPEHG